MAWMRLDETLLRHHKIAKLAHQLNISKPQARGHLITLWLTVLRQSPDGLMTDWDAVAIAEAAEYDGDPDQFLQSLLTCRLLDCNNGDSGQYTIHDWMEYQGSYKASKDKALYRERKRLSSDSPKTIPGQSPDCLQMSLYTGHDRTVQDNNPYSPLTQKSHILDQLIQAQKTKEGINILNVIRDKCIQELERLKPPIDPIGELPEIILPWMQSQHNIWLSRDLEHRPQMHTVIKMRYWTAESVAKPIVGNSLHQGQADYTVEDILKHL